MSLTNCLHITAFLCGRRPALGPMPNEEINVRKLESLEKYRSYGRYLKHAEEAKNKPVWWKTYRSYVEKADPEHGEEWRKGLLFGSDSGGGRSFKVQGLNETRSVAGAERVDIGLPYSGSSRTKQLMERRQVMKDKKKNVELERASRLRTRKPTHTHHEANS